MPKFDSLTKEEKAQGIRSVASQATDFDVLDRCADLARKQRLWHDCSSAIHKRNMFMLGKVRKGYPPAVWKKGWHKVTVENERGLVKGERIHVRELCDRGYRYVPRRR